MKAQRKCALLAVTLPLLGLIWGGCPTNPDTTDDGYVLGGLEEPSAADSEPGERGGNFPGPREDQDSDGDGLTDKQELEGWEVWIDSFAQASLGEDSYLNTFHYRVTSNPNDADTDDDGLPDLVEFVIKSDPKKIDSDKDGLRDEEEWNQWLTSPTNVDTDGDSRGDPTNEIAPNQALFDGAEMFDLAVLPLEPGDPLRIIKPRATSPTLADTDGDGFSDFAEFDSTVRNGVLADLPLLEYELVGDMNIKLNVEYEETIGQETEYGVTLTESQSETVASESSQTVGWSFEIGIEQEIAYGPLHFGSTKLHATAGVSGEHTWTNSMESSRESSKEVSRIESDSREFTEAAADGEIKTAILLTNPGKTTFTLNSLGVLVSKHEKKKGLGDITPPKRKTLATLTPVFDSITLAPGETAGPFELGVDGVNATAIKELLAAPDTLMLGTANMEFTDANGLNFDYVRQFTVAQTAHLTIDLGDGEVRQYNVATNVDRNPDSTYRGITLRRVLEENLGLPFEDAARGYTTMPNPEPDNDREVLESLLGRRYAVVGGVTVANWTVVSSNPEHRNSNVNDILLQAGDDVGLIFQRDDDGDGLSNTLEKASGADVSPGSGDADGDTLSDYEEVAKGWIAFAAPSDTGMLWASEIVSASSSRAGHPATAALGAPDTTAYGSAPTAWSPNPQNGSLQFIDVRFGTATTAIYASGVTIRETWGNGFVYQVDASEGGVLRTVWRGTDPSLPGAPEEFHITWPVTDFTTRRLRIWVDTDANLDTWEEIDAIALHGYPDKRAHRVMSDPRFADSDDDGLTDAQEKAGATADPALFLSSDPLDPDTDGDGLMDNVDPFPTIAARTKYVRADAAAGGNGNTWQTAYQTIQQALTAAATGQGTPTNSADDVSQIWVASGVYEPTNRTTPIALLNQVAIYGGFTGSETKRGQRNTNPFANGCVITGDLNGDDTGVSRLDFLDVPGSSTENSRAVLSAGSAIDSSAVLDGFMITGAYALASDIGATIPRGGLYAQGSPTIQNCLFTGNGNLFGGAGVWLAPGAGACNAVFRKCIFAGNVANTGAGVFVGVDAGAIVFEDCEFSQNEARSMPNSPNTDHPGSRGGGVSVGGGSGAVRVDFNRCAFTGNAAHSQGGGIYYNGNTSTYLRVDTCRFYSNRTTRSTAGSSAAFRGTGGAIAFEGQKGSISNSDFWDNRATFNGGGIALTNTLNTGNPKRLTITNCTLAYNRSINPGFDGGGIFASGACAPSIENTIAWQNYHGLGAIPDWDASSNAPMESQQIYVTNNAVGIVRNCCLNGGSPGRFVGNGGNFAADPSFNGLDLGDLSLSEQSPCIDRGNTFVDLDPLLAGFQLLPAFDVAGKTRITDGNGDAIEAVDIGAFEAPAPQSSSH